MAAKTSGASPDQWREYDEAFKAKALCLVRAMARAGCALKCRPMGRWRLRCVLQAHGLRDRHGNGPSTGRRGNGYDNVHAASFGSHFKAELLDGGSFPNLTEARPEISRHMAYCNAERHHSVLGYYLPNHFETRLQTTSQHRPA